MTRKLKTQFVSCWRRAEEQKERRKLQSFIEKTIQKSKDEIPKLTEDHERDIRRFWNAYGFENVPLQWHRFYYAKTGQVRPEFIPAPIFYQRIKPAMNNVSYGAVWSDKSYLDFFLRDIPTASCVLRNVNGRLLDADFRLVDWKSAEKLLNAYDALVVKPSVDTNTGKGVVLLHPPYSIERIVASHHKNFVVQIPLRQCPDMGKLNESSVNTIRVNSVLLETEAHAMSAFVKVGQAGAFADNNGHDRYFIGIRNNGTYMDYAIDHDFNRYSAIPSKFDFAGQPVPSYGSICETVERAHQQIAHFGFAFWDVCVREDGVPVIVEMNLKNPDSMVPQVATGPFFGEYTDDVLGYIRRR